MRQDAICHFVQRSGPNSFLVRPGPTADPTPTSAPHTEYSLRSYCRAYNVSFRQSRICQPRSMADYSEPAALSLSSSRSNSSNNQYSNNKLSRPLSSKLSNPCCMTTLTFRAQKATTSLGRTLLAWEARRSSQVGHPGQQHVQVCNLRQ